MVILADTSVWVDYLRSAGTRADTEWRDLLVDRLAEAVICEPIVMELLSKPTDPFTVRRLEEQLDAIQSLPVDPERDFREAAALARAVRRSGHTVRSIVDCLIAALAMRHQAELWHRDEDFVRIAAVSDLRYRDLR